jgi:hypothetical protein
LVTVVLCRMRNPIDPFFFFLFLDPCVLVYSVLSLRISVKVDLYWFDYTLSVLTDFVLVKSMILSVFVCLIPFRPVILVSNRKK